jgi:hypothetical protein
MDTKRQERAVETAREYTQGNIDGLDEAMTRRLVASVVLTESNGGNLSITNHQGYVGRYQAGASWLADAGYVDQAKFNSAMTGFKTEWSWAESGGMTRFLRNSSNWHDGLTLDKYKQSADLQDQAFKRNSSAAYRQAAREKILKEDDDPARIAGFLKARHIAGFSGAKAVIQGKSARSDSNGTTNYDYFNDIAKNRDGLDQLISRSPDPEHIPGRNRHEASAMPAEQPLEERQLQESLNHLGYRDPHGHPLTIDGTPGPNTQHAIKSFQHAHRLHVDGVAGKDTLAALVDARHSPLLSEATHPAHPLYTQVLHGIRTLPHGTFGSEDEQRNLAVALTIAAHVGGLKKIDHVVLGTNGVNVFAVQGRLDDPAHLRTHVDRVQSMTHTVDHSSLAFHQVVRAHAVHAHLQTLQQGLAMEVGR